MHTTYLLCLDAEHADLVDQIVFARLPDEEGAKGNSWSGVFTDGQQFGILWAAPVSDLFGQPEDFPELTLVEDTDGKWIAYQPPAEDEAP